MKLAPCFLLPVYEPRPMRWTIRFVSGVFILMATLLTPSTPGNTLQEDVVINNFTFGGLDYIINGKKAVLHGERVNIEEIRAKFYRHGRDIFLNSAECNFDQIKRAGSGEKHVRVTSKNLTIDGVGFDLLLNQNRIIVRNDVKVRILNYQRHVPADPK